MTTEYGPLAAALAKAQAAFPPISRDKTVTVQTTKGGTYTFKYAPLDSILAAVRGPLAENGLAIVQLLDEDVLVTSLLHESGAILSGRTPIPQSEGVQAYGSAITYLRRYSIQALLGIAAEEDDDGNQAAGNKATFSKKVHVPHEPQPATREQAESMEPVLVGPWTGTGKVDIHAGQKSYKGVSDGNLRSGPEGVFAFFSFDTTDDKTIPQVRVNGAFAADLIDATAGQLHGLVATIAGDLYSVPWEKDGKRMPPFQRLELHHIEGEGGLSLPVPEPTAAMFDESELDAIPL